MAENFHNDRSSVTGVAGENVPPSSRSPHLNVFVVVVLPLLGLITQGCGPPF